MKTIGLIGGVSYPSTIKYYNEINKRVSERISPDSSAKVVINSIDFSEVTKYLYSGRYDDLTGLVRREIVKLLAANVDLIGICSNTLHYCIDEVRQMTDVPVISVVEEIVIKVNTFNLSKVGLLGLRAVKDCDIYTKPLKDSGVETIFPNEEDRKRLEEIIFKELNRGIESDDSKKFVASLVLSLVNQGAERIILACTALSTIIEAVAERQELIIDTLDVHVEALVREALSDSP
ncbi:amino acid racemase [Patescibacteria group bacterium]|nr:amino acid racemase [Patescibacteria group bacterium]